MHKACCNAWGYCSENTFQMIRREFIKSKLKSLPNQNKEDDKIESKIRSMMLKKRSFKYGREYNMYDYCGYLLFDEDDNDEEKS